MEGKAILREQQKDFISRLKRGNLLPYKEKYVFGEYVTISRDAIASIVDSLEILKADDDSFSSSTVAQNIFKNRIARHAISLVYGDLLVEVNPDKNIVNDYLVLALRESRRFRIIVKICTGNISDTKWVFYADDLGQNQMVFCLYSPDNISLDAQHITVVFAGFNCSEYLLYGRETFPLSLSVNDLLYAGGLRPYLSSMLLETNDYLERANFCNSKGDYRGAVYCYNKILESHSRDYKTYLLRAIAYWRLGEEKKALEDLDRAIELNPNYELAYHWRGFVKYNLKDYQGAIVDFSEEIRVNPMSAYAYYRRALAYEKAKNLLKAFEDYLQVIRLNRNLYQAFYNCGNVRYELGDKEGALADYQQALKLNPSLAKAYYNIGKVYRDLGDNERAVANYQKAIELLPSYAKAHYNLALIYMERGEYRMALHYYEKACEFAPDLVQAKHNKKLLLEYLEAGEKNNVIPLREYKVRKEKEEKVAEKGEKVEEKEKKPKEQDFPTDPWDTRN
ncbi:MAG: tetratricopeptide repeat protein [Geminocystis sp.]|nr:tetratricopeptide repeat protein [Geminocystis sp.]HIK37340.1 tetratricopeptide repeat protein [Geminocystis sp. M7585_C2015_104]MCS7148297.1 tetratricopeptide repeat protein [Geminocystis sp.]MCX8077712.1 tetratricopeptide repeat protein [Geminocystis sp.]MDW8116604.1 tetratricopeptide repeat protein [Geminocystis sp.]